MALVDLNTLTTLPVTLTVCGQGPGGPSGLSRLNLSWTFSGPLSGDGSETVTSWFHVYKVVVVIKAEPYLE